MKKKSLITLVTSLVCAFSCMNITASAASYADGTYTGSALGLNDNINVEVVISNGEISDIVVVSHSDDEPYISDAQGVIDKILANQSTDVDVVSGATYSSKGIIGAVADALSNAEAPEEPEATTEEEVTSTSSDETTENKEDGASDSTTTSDSKSSSSETTKNNSSNNNSNSTTTKIATEDTATQTSDNSLVGIAMAVVVCGIAGFGVSKVKKNIKK